MFLRSAPAIALTLAAVVSTNCFAQIQLQIQAELIERAEELAMDLLEQRGSLPEKWAALQEREVHHLTNLEELESGKTTTREFWAHSKQGSVTIQNLNQHSYYDRGIDRTESLDVATKAYKRPGLVLYKPKRSKSWEIVPKVPFNGYPTTDPFSWCIGNYTSTKTGTMDEGYIDRFVSKRTCVHAKEVKAGLVAVWGAPLPQKTPTSTATILFDKFTNLPMSVEWRYYPSDWHPKNFLKLDNRLIEKISISWQKFKVEQKDQKEVEIFLPIKAESVFTGVLRKEHLEVVNRIRWLLNDQVPDALFEDPTKNEIVEPEFPDYPKDEQKSR